MGACEYQLPVEIKPPDPTVFPLRIYLLEASTKIYIELPADLRNDQIYLRLISSDDMELKSFKKVPGNENLEIDISDLSAGIIIFRSTRFSYSKFMPVLNLIKQLRMDMKLTEGQISL